MALNFNVDPYYDDFDPSKNYHRILFKPGYAVQARELTQAQSILQDQISKFAGNIFSQNTPVSGGNITTNLNCYYIKLNVTQAGASILASSFLGKTIINAAGTVIAKVIATAESTITTDSNGNQSGDNPTLIVTYTTGPQFGDATQIYDLASPSSPIATTIGSTGGTTCTGLSSVASISSGVFYIVNGYSLSASTGQQYSIGNFVTVNPQTTILNKYNNLPSYRIGLLINETIYDYVNDSTLLDPAIGASNYQAPGADRYVIQLELVTLPLNSGDDSAFIELVRIQNGNILKQVNETVYSAIDDYFAKRDYETNGDYVVNDFTITPSPNASDPSKYNLSVGKGIAYVHGYRVENQSTQVITTDRARTYATVPGNNSISISYGDYFVVDSANGVFDFTTMPQIDLHCVPAGNISQGSATNYNQTLIGNAFIKGLDYISDSGTPNTYIFNAYVSDIIMNTFTGNATSATVNTITFYDPSNKYSTSATANAYYGATITITSGKDVGDTRLITGYNGASKTANVSPAWTITPDSTSQFTLSFTPGQIESLVQATSYNLTANANINTLNGKISGVFTNDTKIQSYGNPELIFPVGLSYVANVPGTSIIDTSYQSTQIYRGYRFDAGTNKLTIQAPTTGIQFVGTPGSPLPPATLKQYYTLINTQTGQILDFSNQSGNTANVINNSGTYSVEFYSPTYTTQTSSAYVVDVLATINIPSQVGPDSTTTILKTKTLVVGNTTYSSSSLSPVSGTGISLDTALGQVYITKSSITANSMPLYVSDVKRITKIWDTGTTTTISGNALLSNYTDITSSFSFDNGQRDTYYDFASIKLLPGVNPPVGNILVCFDYYSHGGGDGFFDINSYVNENYSQIPFYTAKSGKTYALRDVVDFRPTRKSGSSLSSYTWEYAGTTTGNGSSGGMLLPLNPSYLTNGYSYYLGRKDKLVLTKNSEFLVIEGTPSRNPVPPTEPNGSLLLANLTLDPYTAYIPGENPDGLASNLSIDKVIHKRWAKSDITDLQTQVNNLEYYTTLNQLESLTASTQVPDNNGITRPNYGILVDDFSSFAAADSSNPNYASKINIRKNHMGPLEHIDNFQLQNPVVLSGYGTITNAGAYTINSIQGTNTNLFTLPYTTANAIVQPLSSGTISVNPFNVVVQSGIATLNPPMDNWVNWIEPPSILVTNPNLQFNQLAYGVNLINAGDVQALIGTTSTVSSSSTQSGTTNPNNVNSTSPGVQITGATGVVSAASFINTTTQSYVNQLQALNKAETSTAVADGLTNINGYITNTAVQPYIRPQEVVVRAGGLLVNTPIHCWFDGKNIDNWITTPNYIKLTGVTGTFQQDDIVGFLYNSSTFYPVARVVSVQQTGTTATIGVATLLNVPNYVGTSVLQNAYFNNDGSYAGTSAKGTITFTNSSPISIHTSGEVSGVGGTFTSSTQLTPTNLFKSLVSATWCNFLNNYGIWGDQNDGSSYATKFPFTATTAGTYTVQASIGDGVAGTISVNNNALTFSPSLSSTTTSTATVTLTAGQSCNVSWSLTNSNVYYQNPAVAITITDPSGTLVWDTLSPPNLTRTGSTSNSLPDGGILYTNASSIQLDKSASTSDGFYNGCTISVKYTYTYAYNYGAIYYPPPAPFSGDGDSGRYNAWLSQVNQYNSDVAADQLAQRQSKIILSSTGWNTATVASYVGSTRTATFTSGQTVAVSIGNSKQYGRINSTYSITGTQNSFADAVHAGSGIPTLSTDSNGNFIGIFNIPGSEFFTGQRIFRVDNRVGGASSTDPTTATTYAEATFYATGLQTLAQSSNYSPSVDSSVKTFTQTGQAGYNIVASQPNIDPIAQTFSIDKQAYPDGIFLSSLRLFFAPFTSTTPTVPVTVSIVGTLNGYPNGQKLAYSTKKLDAKQITTSSTPYYADASTGTTFTFDAPVYLQPGILYAFTVESTSSDYNLYLAQQNQVIYPSSTSKSAQKIGQAPNVGSLFESQNSGTWVADPTKSLMFVIDKCVFDITKSGVKVPLVVPYRLPNRKLSKNDITHSYNNNSIADSINNVQSYFSLNSRYHAFNLTTTDLIPSGNTNINYSYITTKAVGQTPTTETSITPGKYGAPLSDHVYLNDGNGERVLLTNSNNSFQLNATLTSLNANVSPIICDDGVSLYTVFYYINNMGIDGNIIQVTNPGAAYNVSTLKLQITSGITNSNSTNDLGTSDIPVFSTPTLNSSNGISKIIVSYPGSGYLVNPTITIIDNSTRTAIGTISATTSSNVVTGTGTAFTANLTVGSALTTNTNIILGTIQSITNANSLILTTNSNYVASGNNFFNSNATFSVSGETSPFGGNGYAKYFTKKVQMVPGNDAGDLRVYYTAYKPIGSEVYIYYKLLNSSDTSVFEQQNWQLMTQVNNQNVYSKSRTNLIEYEWAPGVNNVANNYVTYTSTNGKTYNSFIQFAIKVVMATNDRTNVPYLNDIRAIALPSGTGL
jgi:hypothetical protein